MNISFKRERGQSLIPELKRLLPLHWEEIGLNHLDVPLDPDFDSYIAIENAGQLYVATVRDDDLLVGYWIGFVKGHLHYKSTLHAIADIYFVEKTYRKNGVGLKFFQWLEEDLKSLGVKKIFTGCKVNNDHTALFEHLGFTQSDKMFQKILTNDNETD